MIRTSTLMWPNVYKKMQDYYTINNKKHLQEYTSGKAFRKESENTSKKERKH